MAAAPPILIEHDGRVIGLRQRTLGRIETAAKAAAGENGKSVAWNFRLLLREHLAAQDVAA